MWIGPTTCLWPLLTDRFCRLPLGPIPVGAASTYGSHCHSRATEVGLTLAPAARLAARVSGTSTRMMSSEVLEKRPEASAWGTVMTRTPWVMVTAPEGSVEKTETELPGWMAVRSWADTVRGIITCPAAMVEASAKDAVVRIAPDGIDAVAIFPAAWSASVIALSGTRSGGTWATASWGSVIVVPVSMAEMATITDAVSPPAPWKELARAKTQAPADRAAKRRRWMSKRWLNREMIPFIPITMGGSTGENHLFTEEVVDEDLSPVVAGAADVVAAELVAAASVLVSVLSVLPDSAPAL